MSKLNKEEKELLNSLDNNEWHSITKVEEAKTIYQSYAEEYLQGLIEKRRLEIANNAEAIVKDFQAGKLKKGTSAEIKAYLLADD